MEGILLLRFRVLLYDLFVVNLVGFRGIHPPIRVWRYYLFAPKLYDLFVVNLVGCRGIHSPTRCNYPAGAQPELGGHPAAKV